MELFTIDVSDVADMRAAIENFAAEPNGGLILNRGLPLELQREFPRLAEQYRLPSITGAPPRSDRTLMSYSIDNAEVYRKAAASWPLTARAQQGERMQRNRGAYAASSRQSGRTSSYRGVVAGAGAIRLDRFPQRGD